MPVYVFGELELDAARYELRRRGELVEIGPRAFDVLHYLIEHRERLVPRNELIERVWGASAIGASAVPTCIATLRKTLGDDPASPVFVETSYGRGYRFIAEVREIEDPSRAGAAGDSAAGRRAPELARSPFVGREAELAALYAAFERSLLGTPQLVLVAGEAGIGKTRILEELAPSVREDGASVLLGRCAEGEGAPAFWPWVQMVRSYLESTDAAALATALGRATPALFPLLPELAERYPELPPLPPLDAEQARFRLFEAVATLLAKAAAERPLALLLDDLHRADTASLLLLQFALRELRDAPLLFVGAYRDVELQSDTARTRLLADLARAEPTRCMHLRGLSRDNVEHFIAQASPSGAASESLVATLYDQTGGNPFFLTQIVHLLAAEGLLDPAPADRAWKIELPGGIREAVARQVAGQPETTRRLLSVAAVAGREFAAAVLASALEKRSDDVLAALDPAVDAHLLAPVPGGVAQYRFAHVLLRDCIYDALPTPERVQLHRRIGEALEALYAGHLDPHAAELAHHFCEAQQPDTAERAIAYAVRAGDWATARLAYEDAPEHYRRALRLLEEPPSIDLQRKAELLLALGEAELRAGERERAQETLKEAAKLARSLGQPDLLARAALSLAPGFFAIEVGVYDPVLVSLLEEALAALDPGDSALRARLLARLSIALVWSDAEERRTELSQEAVAMARRIGDPETLARALSARHETLWGPGKLAERRAVVDEIGEAAAAANVIEISLMYHLFRINALLEAGEIRGVDEEIAIFSRIAAETGQPHSLWLADLVKSLHLLLDGRYSEAEPLARRFLATGRRAGDINAEHSFAIHLAILRWEQGRTEEIVKGVESIAGQYPAARGWEYVLLFLQSELGDRETVSRSFNAFAERSFEDIPHTLNRSGVLCLLAEVCHDLRDAPRAEQLYRLLLPGKEQNTVIGYSTTYFGTVADRLALLATTMEDWDCAESHFERALQRNASVHADGWVAHTQHHYARMLLKRGSPGDDARARELIAQSLEVGHRLQMHGLTRELRALIESSGVSLS